MQNSKKNKQVKIVIRVDGDRKTGMGHFYRMITLAKSLQKNKWNIYFLTKNSKKLKKLDKNQRTVSLSDNTVREFKKKLLKISPDLVIIDKLKLDTKIINALNKTGQKYLAIDYTGKNKNFIKSGISVLYPNSAKTNTRFKDFRHTIFNELFTNSKPIMIKKNPTSILVLQGGSDTYCFIPKIIDALNSLKKEIRITAILGPSFSCRNELRKVMTKNEKRVKILENIKNMSEIMSKQDIAITAGGMTLLELCHLGIPSVIVCGEKFENETALLMEKNGFGINLGFGKDVSKTRIVQKTQELLENYDKRKKMNIAGKRLVDEKGVDRIIQIIKKMVI